MAIKITHAPFARSVRVIWLCEELGLPYELQIVENNRKFLLSEDYLKIHPFGKIPAFTDGDVHMFESLAIMQYLLDKHENSLAPKMGEETYPAFLQWFHFGESTLALPVTMALGHSRILPEKLRIPAMVTWGEQELQKFFKGLAVPLAQHDYLLPTG
ncbi:MAG: glutathione S-transferase, partial [Pseudomonadota bacterium]